MPKADELYLLFQQCKDLKDATTDKWEVHFQWLEEVIQLARQSRGEAFISKTPARKKRVKKNDIENQPPQSSDVDTVDSSLRKSSRTAAKAAQEKTKQALIEISNIGSKIRRPSTPKKKNKKKAEPKRTEPDVIDISVEPEEAEDIPCEEEFHEQRIPKDVTEEKVIDKALRNSESSSCSRVEDIPKSNQLSSSSKNEVECTSHTEVNEVSSCEESEASNNSDQGRPVRSARTKKLEKPSTPIKDIVKSYDNVFKVPAPAIAEDNTGSSTEETEASKTDEGKPVRSTRTKKLDKPSTPIKDILKPYDNVFKSPAPAIDGKDNDSSTIETKASNDNTEEVKPIRSTRTKKLEKPSTPIKDILKTNDHVFKAPAAPAIAEDNTGSSTEDSSEVSNADQGRPVRSTRTKKLDKPSSPIKDVLKTDDHVFKVPVVLQEDEASLHKDNRSTRTKKRVVEEKEEGPVRTTRTKKRKMEELESSDISDTASESSSPRTNNMATSSHAEIVEVEPQPRITRSKVRNLANKGSPAPKPKNQDCFSPKAQLRPMLQPSKYSDSPGRSPRNKNRKYAKGDVQEVSIEDIDVSSAGRIVKHTRTNDLKNMTSGFPRGKTPYRTPSPVSLSSAKIIGLKNSLISSGTLQSSYSSKRGHVLGSPQIMKPKIIGTPTEVNRVKNILTGPSFLTKVQPSKPTKEESEERKQEELRRRKEREEETRRKKEEAMKAKMEEQKRKNEERMRRVQEAREARERKLALEREAQEKEKKLREERMMEEKRKMAQKNEMKQHQMQLKKKMALEEQQRAKEEMRLKEEQRRREAHLLEEQRRREAHLLEEQRKIEESRLIMEKQRKLLEQKHEAERLAREKYELEKLNEAKRIAREKEELEQLKIKEAQRLAHEQKSKGNGGGESKPLNTTYNKSASQSYEMTPVAKSKPTSPDPDDYGISDLKSDDSTDEDSSPKKSIPSWAKGSQLRKLLYDQEYFPPKSDDIFPPQLLLRLPDLAQIFPKHRSRFFKRTSSAVWNTPPNKVMYTT